MAYNEGDIAWLEFASSTHREEAVECKIVRIVPGPSGRRFRVRFHDPYEGAVAERDVPEDALHPSKGAALSAVRKSMAALARGIKEGLKYGDARKKEEEG